MVNQEAYVEVDGAVVVDTEKEIEKVDIMMVTKTKKDSDIIMDNIYGENPLQIGTAMHTNKYMLL